MQLNQVTISTRDLTRATQFYRRLGLRPIVDSPHYARFECPAPGDGGAPPTFSLHVADVVTPGTTTLYFELPSAAALDDKVQTLQKAGMVFDSEPADQRWGWREARLRDPDGHAICLYVAGDYRRFPPWRVVD